MASIVRPFPADRAQTSVKTGVARRRGQPIAPYLFVLPGLILLSIWAYYPMLDTIRLSFFEGSLVKGVSGYVGMRNYADVIGTPEFRRSVSNTFWYMVGLIPLAVIVPLGVALLAANIRGRMRDFYRSILFTPMIMAPVVVSLIWLWILNPLQGVLNQTLQHLFGWTNINWLADKNTAIWVIVLITGWKILGFSFILFTAAITGIDPEYMEAARIDGANELQVIRRIVFPMLTPTFYFLVLFTILIIQQWAFAPINVLTQGGPDNSTSNVFYSLYQIAFQYFNIGQSSAASVMVFLVFGVGIIAGVKLMDRRAHYDN